MKAVVIGAGIIGVTTAHRLASEGFEVTVIDHQPGPALETSYANGSQLSAGHCVPWANPSAPAKVLKWLFQPDAPLLFTPKLEWKQAKWIAHFFRQCTRENTDFNTAALVHLAFLSRDSMKAIQQQHPELTDDSFQKLNKGILHFYRNHKEYQDAVRDVEFMSGLGLERQLISKEEVFALEPSLAMNEDIIGGTYTSSDASCNARLFTENLSKITEFEESGGSIRYEYGMYASIRKNGDCVDVFAMNEFGHNISFKEPDVVVVCAANNSYDLVKPLGINLTMYPAKGYSATIQLADNELDKAPYVSLTDDENKLVFSRLGNTLRVAGTAHLTDSPYWVLDDVRCQNLVDKTKSIFDLQASEVELWAGARPLTPSNRPYICVTKYNNLYLNTGHGSLGLTMSCGSAEMLTHIVTKNLFGGSVESDHFDFLEHAFSLDIAH